MYPLSAVLILHYLYDRNKQLQNTKLYKIKIITTN